MHLPLPLCVGNIEKSGMNIPEEDTLTSPLDDTDLESPDSTDREQLISNSEREHESVANQDVNDGMHTLHSRNGARALPDNDEGTELMDLSSSRPSALKSPNSLKKSLRVSWGDMHGLPLVSEKEVEMWDRSPVDTRVCILWVCAFRFHSSYPVLSRLYLGITTTTNKARAKTATIGVALLWNSYNSRDLVYYLPYYFDQASRELSGNWTTCLSTALNVEISLFLVFQ